MNNTLMLGRQPTMDAAAVRQASKVLVNFFDSVLALASKPSFTSTGEAAGNNGQVVINMFYYAPKDKALSDSAINSVGKVLSKLFNARVELRLVRLHYPYLNSYILAQYIAINTAKYNFTRIISRLWGANIIFSAPVHSSRQSRKDNLLAVTSNSAPTSYIKGVKVKVSGRLVTQRSVPRKTVETAQIGTFSNSLLSDSASFTSKNKKGAFTVKVWISL